jgi:acetyl-CoA synthetase
MSTRRSRPAPKRVDKVSSSSAPAATSMKDGRDVWYHERSRPACPDCRRWKMNAEDPLFILYTSGSTGKPKGVLHTTGGYLVYASMTHEYVFDYHEGDIYWCTADVGWVTGHSYIVYGPLANGATTLMFEGVPTYPSPARFWEVVDKHKVNIFYTAPTAIRALMGAGDDHVTKTSRKSLRTARLGRRADQPGSLGVVLQCRRRGRCPIVDTWWQTETGGILITPLPGATDLKPGSATRPFFGVQPALVDAERARSWKAPPRAISCISTAGRARCARSMATTSASCRPISPPTRAMYFTGDGCRRDEDGYYWITGRVDDVINVSGHRMGTAEVESALVAHPKVSEAAVVGYPHDIKGQGIYAYVTLMEGEEPTTSCARSWSACPRRDRPDRLAGPDPVRAGPAEDPFGQDHAPHPAQDRRGRFGALGDTSTLADPAVVDDLIENRQNRAGRLVLGQSPDQRLESVYHPQATPVWPAVFPDAWRFAIVCRGVPLLEDDPGSRVSGTSSAFGQTNPELLRTELPLL